MKLSPRILDSTAASSDENVRMRPVHSTIILAKKPNIAVDLDTYGVQLLTFASDSHHLNY